MKKIMEKLEKINCELSDDLTVIKDEVIIRELIADEQTAVKKYKDFATKTYDDRVMKVLLSIAKEEEVHISELETLLKIIGISDTEANIKGSSEVIDLINN